MVEIIKADKMGFCFGVDDAVKTVREAIKENQGRKIFLTNELIHNPIINLEMKEKNIIFLNENPEEVKKEDVVIIPAFGIKKELYEELIQKGCEIIDTTCSIVRNVQIKIKDFNEKGLTTIYFGKIGHEETEATVSYADNYLIFTNQEDIDVLCEYYKTGKDPLEHFKERVSKNFNIEKLDKIGIVAQTTMLKTQVENFFNQIQQSKANNNISKQDTICGATQVRQKGVEELAEKVKIIIVIGGYNSSNTRNLAKIAKQKGIIVYHIDGNPNKVTKESISYQPLDSDQEITKEKWLVYDKIGVTSGASTPDKVTEKIIEKISNF